MIIRAQHPQHWVFVAHRCFPRGIGKKQQLMRLTAEIEPGVAVLLGDPGRKTDTDCADSRRSRVSLSREVNLQSGAE
jgi:hypothetical protein